ncbi:MAG: PHP domain-containing protein [Dethiobacteraceae bacterium]|jgi:putative hydrolase|nr:PHP domain-containing protein [Bacillota bacterium]
MWATADLHTHTIYSHGRGTIRENVLAAKQRGLHTIGIADHGPGHLFIGVRGVEALHRMREEINGLQSEFPELEILLGVEANIVDVDGTIDVPEEILPELDYLLVGFHKLVRPRSGSALWLGAQNFLTGWLGLQSLRLRRQNTAAICAAVRRYPVYAITHPGLQIAVDTKILAAVCAEAGTFLEINSSYADRLAGYVQAALPSGVQFVINSDAHTPDRVGDFTAAFQLIEKLQIPSARLVNIAAAAEEKAGDSQGKDEFIYQRGKG